MLMATHVKDIIDSIKKRVIAIENETIVIEAYGLYLNF